MEKYILEIKRVSGSMEKEDQSLENKAFKSKILITKEFHLSFCDMRFG